MIGMGTTIGYLICSSEDFSSYAKKGILPESGYRRIFFMNKDQAEGYVQERPTRNLYILKFKIPNKWITNYDENLKLFECVHELNLRKYLVSAC